MVEYNCTDINKLIPRLSRGGRSVDRHVVFWLCGFLWPAHSLRGCGWWSDLLRCEYDGIQSTNGGYLGRGPRGLRWVVVSYFPSPTRASPFLRNQRPAHGAYPGAHVIDADVDGNCGDGTSKAAGCLVVSVIPIKRLMKKRGAENCRQAGLRKTARFLVTFLRQVLFRIRAI